VHPIATSINLGMYLAQITIGHHDHTFAKLYAIIIDMQFLIDLRDRVLRP
jgi:hypothetical protein